MRQSRTPETAPQPPDGETGAIRLIIDMADTTWRMFVPIVGLLLLGRYADNYTGTKPALMLFGAALGAGVAALLIQSQLRRKS